MISPSLRQISNHKVQLELLTKHVMFLDVLGFLKYITIINYFSNIFRTFKDNIYKYLKKKQKINKIRHVREQHTIKLLCGIFIYYSPFIAGPIAAKRTVFKYLNKNIFNRKKIQ